MCTRADALSESLNAITVSTELTEEELRSHLDTVLISLLEKSKCRVQVNTWVHVNT